MASFSDLMHPFLASLTAVPIAVAGIGGAAKIGHHPGMPPRMDPPAVVSQEQVPAQKQAVEQAIAGLKTADAALTSVLQTLNTDRTALEQAVKDKNDSLVVSLKTKLEQDRAALKTAREAHREAMQKVMIELLKLPEADRQTFKAQLDAMRDAHKDAREEFGKGVGFGSRGGHRGPMRGGHFQKPLAK